MGMHCVTLTQHKVAALSNRIVLWRPVPLLIRLPTSVVTEEHTTSMWRQTTLMRYSCRGCPGGVSTHAKTLRCAILGTEWRPAHVHSPVKHDSMQGNGQAHSNLCPACGAHVLFLTSSSSGSRTLPGDQHRVASLWVLHWVHRHTDRAGKV